MRPAFNTHGVASHDLNRRSGQRVEILRRFATDPRTDPLAVQYRVRFPDGVEETAFAGELSFEEATA